MNLASSSEVKSIVGRRTAANTTFRKGEEHGQNHGGILYTIGAWA